MRCSEVHVGDMRANHSMNAENTKASVGLVTEPLSFECLSNYGYKYGVVKGSGRMSVSFNDSDVDLGLDMISDDYGRLPPSTPSLGHCGMNLRIDRMHFSGGVVADILPF